MSKDNRAEPAVHSFRRRSRRNGGTTFRRESVGHRATCSVAGRARPAVPLERSTPRHAARSGAGSALAWSGSSCTTAPRPLVGGNRLPEFSRARDTRPPLDDTRPRRLERVLPSTPRSRRSLARPVRRSHLAGAPGQRQAPQKAVEVGVALRHGMDRRARGQSGQMMLNRTDLVQQPERIQGAGQRPQAALHRGGNRVRGEQPRTRRRWRVVALVHAGAEPGLLRELERRLEHVHEQARAAECRRASASAPRMPSRRPYPTSRRTTAPFFCSTPRLVVLPIRPRPRQLAAVLPQKPINTSLRNSLPLSVSIPRNGNGRAPRSRLTASDHHGRQLRVDPGADRHRQRLGGVRAAAMRAPSPRRRGPRPACRGCAALRPRSRARPAPGIGFRHHVE